MAKEYKVPYELVQLNSKAQARSDLMDRLIRLPFTYKKCLKLAEEFRSIDADFWFKIRQLHNLQKCNLKYIPGKRVVEVLKEEESCDGG